MIVQGYLVNLAFADYKIKIANQTDSSRNILQNKLYDKGNIQVFWKQTGVNGPYILDISL